MAKGITNSNAASDRTSVIQAVKTPLSFLVLGFLIIDGTIGALAISLPDYRTPLIWTVIISVPSLVVLVAAMAIWRPEVPRGRSTARQDLWTSVRVRSLHCPRRLPAKPSPG